MGSDGYAKNLLAKFGEESKMKQVAVVRNLRIVQVPITDWSYTISPGINLPFRQFVPIDEQLGSLGGTIERSFDSVRSEREKKRMSPWKRRILVPSSL